MAYLGSGVHHARIEGGAPIRLWRVALLAENRAASVAPRAMVKPIYKILADAAYDAAKSEGHFVGTADDLRDGFIHFSAGHQVAETLAKHYPGQEELVLLSVDPDRLAPALKWEESRGGDLFPHLYGPLELNTVVAEAPLELDEDDLHILPDGVA